MTAEELEQLRAMVLLDDKPISWETWQGNVYTLLRALPALLAAHAERDALAEENKLLREAVLDGADAQPGQVVILCDDGSLLACDDVHVLPDDVVLAARAALVEQEGTP